MQALQVVEEQAESLERMLHAWRPRRLGEREQGGVKFTEFGEFASVVVNGRWSPMRAGRGSLHRRLPNARASFRGGQVELRGIDSVRYATLLDPLEYGDGEVEPGTFNAALYEGVEYIETLSFAPLNRHDGVEKLKLMRRQLLASQDPAASQIAAMEEAISETSDGRSKIGEFHCSYAVFADTPQDSKRNASRLASAIGELTGIRLVRIDLLADRAWYSQCPGNLCWRARKAHLTTRAFAALAANHGFYQGKRDNNPWGQAVLMARARSRQKLCVNLHKSPPHEESEGKKYPGATLILGPNGTGKTVLEAAFLLQSRRWNPAPDIIVLDKDRSLELVVRAMRGKYKRLAVNEPTGINPFEWADTPAHRAFWRALVLAMVYDPTLPIATSEKVDLDAALAAMCGPDFDVSDRGVSTLCGLLPKSGPQGESSSIRTRLMRWQSGQELGWVFDEVPDDVPSDVAVAAFDYTEFLDKAEIRTPILMALLQYAEDKIDGRRVMLVMEEAWKPLKDPVLAAFAHDKAKTIRKKNGLPIFTTQEPVDLCNDNVGDTLRSQAASIVCFPDSASSPKAYLEGLRLTAAEYEVVRTLGQHGGHYFFFKQGEASCVVEFDLAGMDEHIWVLSGAEDNVRLLDEIRAEVGDDPDDWMPVLFQRIREREFNRQRRSA
jgi:type IV secretion system protein VirB4